MVRLDAERALVQTVDFFSPVVDDPFDFGMIAAANALGDVYAMGGRPLTAMNLVAFPAKDDLGILRRILAGGLAKVREAGALLVGGHSVDDPEIKYGLSVTGIVHPDRVLTNAGARPGDSLVLSKPLGTGIVATALKSGKAPPDRVAEATGLMARLDRWASEAAVAHGARAATDVTGFGLLGHAAEMAIASGIAIRIHASQVPVIRGAADLAKAGMVPGGTGRNRSYFSCKVDGLEGISRLLGDILFDPQTSGGLLVPLSPDRAQACVEAMREAGDTGAAVIGEALASPEGRIIVVP